MSGDTLHQALLDPAFYPEVPQEVTFCETHISRLYFTGGYVYKVKKPVDFGFLNFTTLRRRAHFCHEEVRLNDRFAPDTYLRVAKIKRSNGGFHLDGRGETVEYAVVMRLLPAARMLPRLLETNDPALPQHMRDLARRLSQLQLSSMICGGKGRHLRNLRRNWEENFRQCRPMVGITLSAATFQHCQNFVSAFIARHRATFLRREAYGKIRDGHGDLHADHICLSKPILIFDCIEFNRRFRQDDVLSDIAFLLMDLDFRGRPDLAELLFSEWNRSLGDEEVAESASLLVFFQLYRAFVRGKVNAFLAADSTAPVTTRTAAADDARRYFALTLGYLVPPTLFLTCGLMGVGKSTVARPLALACRARHLRSDIVRKELAGLSSETAVRDSFGTGLYAPQHNLTTYVHLLELARTELAAGHSVVIDASFARRDERNAFRQLAHDLGRPCVLLHCQCDEATVLSRLDARQAQGRDPSDGRRELLTEQKRRFNPPTPEEGALQLDTSLDAHDHVEFVLNDLLRHHGSLPK